jgi:uncharacterized membrane protein
VALVGVVGVGAISEILGLYLGIPFGYYSYTQAWTPTLQLPSLQPAIADPGKVYFPLQLPFAWLMVVGGAYGSLLNVGSPTKRILYAALTATVIDFLMEEVMVKVFHYWIWNGDKTQLPGGAPIQNSVGWFVVSITAGLVLSKGKFQDQAQKECRIMLGFYCLLMLVAYLFRI